MAYNKTIRENNLKSERWKCCVCGEVFPTRRAKQLHNKEFHPNRAIKGYCPHKGKTKDNCESIRKSIETRKKNIASGKTTSWWKGKHHSEETRKKLSEKLRAYYQEHPEEFPFRKAHYTNGESYAEKYFREWLEKEGIEHKCQYSISSYHLDFLIGNIDLEIDGEQHYNFSRIAESDERRTKFLEDNGFQVIRIRWSYYNKLTQDERHTFLEELKKSLLSQTGLPDGFEITDKKIKKIYCYCPVCNNPVTIKKSVCCSKECAQKLNYEKYYSKYPKLVELIESNTLEQIKDILSRQLKDCGGNLTKLSKLYGFKHHASSSRLLEKFGVERNKKFVRVNKDE